MHACSPVNWLTLATAIASIQNMKGWHKSLATVRVCLHIFMKIAEKSH